MDTDSLRSDGVGIRSIYHWSLSSTGVANPRPLWKAHPFAGQPSDRSCRPTVLTVSAGTKGLNWRTAYRTKTREKLKLKLGTLSEAWQRMKDSDLQLTTRRRLWIVRAAKIAKTAAKWRAASASKQVAAKQLKTSGFLPARAAPAAMPAPWAVAWHRLRLESKFSQDAACARGTRSRSDILSCWTNHSK